MVGPALVFRPESTSAASARCAAGRSRRRPTSPSRSRSSRSSARICRRPLRTFLLAARRVDDLLAIAAHRAVLHGVLVDGPAAPEVAAPSPLFAVWCSGAPARGGCCCRCASDAVDAGPRVRRARDRRGSAAGVGIPWCAARPRAGSTPVLGLAEHFERPDAPDLRGRRRPGVRVCAAEVAVGGWSGLTSAFGGPDRARDHGRAGHRLESSTIFGSTDAGGHLTKADLHGGLARPTWAGIAVLGAIGVHRCDP